MISEILLARPGGEEEGEGTIFDPKSSRLLVPNILCPPSSRHLQIGEEPPAHIHPETHLDPHCKCVKLEPI